LLPRAQQIRGPVGQSGNVLQTKVSERCQCETDSNFGRKGLPLHVKLSVLFLVSIKWTMKVYVLKYDSGTDSDSLVCEWTQLFTRTIEPLYRNFLNEFQGPSEH
jgi:hypothetical protein